MTASAKKAVSVQQSAPKTIPAPKRKKASAASKKEVIEPISSNDIDEQISTFLKSGGKIQQIPNGVSGQQSGQLPTRKHIVISKKK